MAGTITGGPGRNAVPLAPTAGQASVEIGVVGEERVEAFVAVERVPSTESPQLAVNDAARLQTDRPLVVRITRIPQGGPPSVSATRLGRRANV